MLHRAFMLAMFYLAASATASAEESFYPIVGPDGKIQLIKGTKAAAPKAQEDAGKMAKPVEPPQAVHESSGERENPTVTHGAEYDSDEYVTSEALDGAIQSSNRQRFYLIKDGIGTKVDEGGNGAGGNEVDAYQASTSSEEDSYPVKMEQVTVTAEEAGKLFPMLSACSSKDRLVGAKPIGDGFPSSLVLNRHTYIFLDNSRVIAAYRVGGAGIRTLVSSSFSRSDKDMAFVYPYLAFLSGEGCLTRMVTGYFDRLYPATRSRHPMLRASLPVHTEELYMLVLLPERSESGTQSTLPYASASYGQLKFSLKK